MAAKTAYTMHWTRKGRSYSYTLTDYDILTLARSVAREGKPYSGVVWSLLQRFAWIYPVYKSLASFLQSYVQPINPKWFPNGSLYLSYVARIKRNYTGVEREQRLATAKAQAERRVQFATTPLRDIPSRYTDAIYGVLEGKIRNPVKGAVHYSMSFSNSASQTQARADAQRFADNRSDLSGVVDAGVGFRQGVNWFFSVPGSSNFKVDLDTTEKPTGGMGNVGMTLALVGSGLIGAYALNKIL